MTQEEINMKTAVKFLMHIYDQDIECCAKLATAEADNDKQTIIEVLKVVIAFCIELKMGLEKNG